MQDQQHISNQQFAFFLIFSANKNLFINYARRSMSDEVTVLIYIWFSIWQNGFGTLIIEFTCS